MPSVRASSTWLYKFARLQSRHSLARAFLARCSSLSAGLFMLPPKKQQWPKPFLVLSHCLSPRRGACRSVRGAGRAGALALASMLHYFCHESRKIETLRLVLDVPAETECQRPTAHSPQALFQKSRQKLQTFVNYICRFSWSLFSSPAEYKRWALPCQNRRGLGPPPSPGLSFQRPRASRQRRSPAFSLVNIGKELYIKKLFMVVVFVCTLQGTNAHSGRVERPSSVGYCLLSTICPASARVLAPRPWLPAGPCVTRFRSRAPRQGDLGWLPSPTGWHPGSPYLTVQRNHSATDRRRCCLPSRIRIPCMVLGVAKLDLSGLLRATPLTMPTECGNFFFTSSQKKQIVR